MIAWILERRWRTLLAGVLIVAVPFCGLALYIYFGISTELEQQSIARKKTFADIAAHHIEENIEHEITLGESFTDRPLLIEAIRRNDRQGMLGHLKAIVDISKKLERVFIASPAGILLMDYPTVPEVMGNDFSDRDWFKGVSRTWTPYVSEMYFRKATPRRLVFAIALPVRALDNKVVGVLVMQPKPDFLEKLLNDVEAGGGIVYLVDNRGYLVSHPHVNVDKLINYSIVPAVAKLLKGLKGAEMMHDPMTGSVVVAAYRPLINLKFGIVLQRPLHEVLTPVREITGGLLLFTGIMFLLAGYLAYRWSEILNEFQQIARRLKQEELSEKAYNEFLTLLNRQWPYTGALSTAVLDRISSITCAEAGIFLIYKDGRLEVDAAIGISKPLEADSLALDSIRQRQPLGLKDIPPQTALRIKTGMGEFLPREIIAIPLFFQEEPIGVLELACLHGFKEWDIVMLHRMAGQFAIGLNSLQNYMAMIKLTNELTAANEELQAMNEEVQASNEELTTQQQELTAANRRLAELSRTKSDFLANMSHELRTPLNSILGFSEVLLDELFGALNSKQKEHIGNIYGSGKHLLGLINDILDLAKVESGKIELNASVFPVKDALNAALIMLREKALRHGISLDLDISPEADIAINADERKFKQIMFNLLSNAVKFTPDGGSVRIVAKTAPGSGIRGDCLEIAVSDTGIGIKEEDQAKLFREFTKLESAYTKSYEGTGLGLALTKKLVELHGGRIWVESEPGKGSTFTFALPLSQIENSQKIQDQELVQTSADASNRKALAIDDDPEALAIVEEALSTANYTVLKAKNGKIGIELALSERPDLIVLDLMMPDMNGFEVIEKLKAAPVAGQIPVIVLTGMDISADARGRFTGNVIGVVEKGKLTKHEFMATIRKATRRNT